MNDYQKLLILGIVSQLPPDLKARYDEVLSQLKALVPEGDAAAALALAYRGLEVQE